MMLKGMNSGHAKMADWGMGAIKDLTPEMIAEIGCGGGRNAGALLELFPEARAVRQEYFKALGGGDKA
ncbi:MAG: hypothetical protein IJ129_01930 [Ruminococcus sp.]|nr:hypothetical protein [Ruminococcus sp.]